MEDAEIIIIGGGLAGLTAAIHLSRAGMDVLLVEKKNYPQHKVCGEYLSGEILPYFNSLGIDLLGASKAVNIQQLLYSTQNAKAIRTALPLGGLGISRFFLDNFLYEQAKKNGVKIIHDTAVKISFKNEEFKIRLSSEEHLKTKILLGAFGKRSNLDKNLQREFIQEKSSWLASKGHYKNDNFPNDLVALHNFKGGYCGLSKTETGAINVCYLATYNSFKDFRNKDDFKENVLFKNHYLKDFFENATALFEKDLSIAQISFKEKSLVKQHILMLGDAGGLIHPLCGNGMAMAIHSAKIASEAILNNTQKKYIARGKLEKEYINNWNKNFQNRLQMGRILQKILLNPFLANSSQHLVKRFPTLLDKIISQTHGQPII